jgi:uncharacterized phage protein gp47/JayE
MNFLNENQLLALMIQKAQQSNLISLSDTVIEEALNGTNTENQYLLDLATHAYILSIFQQDMMEIYEATDITTARGSQLDKLGNLVNVPRIPGQPGIIALDLFLDMEETTEIYIPEGTRVLIDNLALESYIEYTTDIDVTIPAGSTTATVTASSNVTAFQTALPADSVVGLEGYPLVNAINSAGGTSGRNIESDDEYRRRILLWPLKNQRGSQQSFESYLSSYEGVIQYKLVPRYNGVGTLKIILNCLSGLASEVQRGVAENCMLYTDEDVVCEEYTPVPITVDVQVTTSADPHNATGQELLALVREHTTAYINGGRLRNGTETLGLGIGEELELSQLVTSIHNAFNEFTSITCTSTAGGVDVDEKYNVTSVNVTTTDA